MEKKELIALADKHKQDILSKYPKQQSLTYDVFEIITELLSVDYEEISPGGKRINVFKDGMMLWLKKVDENGGGKNYFLDIIDVFKDGVIFAYLQNSFGNKSKELKGTIDGTYNRLFTQRGIEAVEKMYRYIT